MFPKFIQNMIEYPQAVSKEYAAQFAYLKELVSTPIVADESIAGPDEVITKAKSKNRSGQKTLQRIADLIISELECATMKDTDEIYFYNKDEGIWENNAEPIIASVVHSVCSEFNRHQIAEIKDKIRRMYYMDRSDFNSHPLLALKNGVIHEYTYEFLEHNPDFLLTTKLNIEYDPTIFPEKFSEFLPEILKVEDVGTVEDYLGYCLLNGYPYSKALICVGKGANGKSTLLNLITAFLGPKNISNALLQDFDKNQFVTSKLYGKKANISSDLPDRDLKHTGIFKMLTGGDTVLADVKHKEPIEFVNSAKMIFSANKAPAILYDDSDAIWRRLILIRFPKQFVGKDRDPHLLDKLITPEELSGILNVALWSLFRLRWKGGFDSDENIKQNRMKYLVESNSIHTFVDFLVEDDLNSYELKADIDKAYMIFAKFVLKQNPKDKGSLTKALPLIKGTAELRKKRIDGYQRRIWRGIKIKSEFRKELLTFNGTAEAADHTFSLLQTKLQLENSYIDRKGKKSPHPLQSPHDYFSKMDELLSSSLESNNGEGIKIDRLLDAGELMGINKKKFVNYIDEGMRRGIFYEPEQGVIARP